MRSATEPADPLAEILGRLTDPTPALLLLRYRLARLPGHIVARLGLQTPSPHAEMLAYQPRGPEGDPGSATAIVEQCKLLAGAGDHPVIVLVPEYGSQDPAGDGSEAQFWKSLNAYRDVLGSLDARIVLCLDPTQESFAFTHARDLISWCAPKFNLATDQLPLAENTAAPIRSDSLEKLSPEAEPPRSRLDRLALGPLWNEILISRRGISLREIEQIALPLLAAQLAGGRVGEAEKLESSISEINLPRGLPRSEWLRLRAEIWRTKGKLSQAVAYLEESLSILEAVLAESPRNPRTKLAIARVMGSLADLLMERSFGADSDRALDLLERALRLQSQVDSNARDVSVSLNKLGDFLSRRGRPGDAEKAFGYYGRSLEVRERLQAANPESAEAARDVSVSLERLGDFLWRRGRPGDAEKALGYFERNLEVRERLHAANPESVEAVRDVSVSLNKLGEFLSRRGRPGDAEKALGYFERSLEVAERLQAANPESAEAARDLVVSMERMSAAIGGRAGGAEKALEHQLRAMDLARKLHQSNPASAYFADTLARAFYFAAQRANSAGQQELAGQCLGGCHQVLHQMVTAGMEVEPAMMELYRHLSEAGAGRLGA